MLTGRRSSWQTPLVVVTGLLLVLGVVLAVRTRNDAGSGSAATTGVTAATGAGQQPQPTPAAAVKALLDAEQRGDHEASFHLLSTAALEAYPDAESWGKRRTGVPDITGFSVGSSDKDVVVTTVAHKPGLDPFVGLSPAHDTERWHTVKVAGGYLVDGDPEIIFDLPADGAAADVALKWAKAVQSCDKKAAVAVQVESDLLGAVDGPAGLCKAPGTLAVSKATPVRPGPAAADLVAQYSDAALSWARAVQVQGAPNAFSVILAPIGDNWRVLGTSQS